MIQTLLDYLADPDLAFVLLTVGALLVLLELANPGMIVPGVVGGLAVVAGLVGLSNLPVSPPGLVLLVLAVTLFVAEVLAPSTGFFASFGVLAMIGAGAFLFQGEVAVSLGVLLPVTLVTGGGVLLAGRLALKARNQPPTMVQGRPIHVPGLVPCQATLARLMIRPRRSSRAWRFRQAM